MVDLPKPPWSYCCADRDNMKCGAWNTFISTNSWAFRLFNCWLWLFKLKDYTTLALKMFVFPLKTKGPIWLTFFTIKTIHLVHVFGRRQCLPYFVYDKEAEFKGLLQLALFLPPPSHHQPGLLSCFPNASWKKNLCACCHPLFNQNWIPASPNKILKMTISSSLGEGVIQTVSGYDHSL